MKQTMEQQSKLQDLLSRCLNPDGTPNKKIQCDTSTNLRQQFYRNIVTFRWGYPKLDYISTQDEWYHEVNYDRRALIEDPTVILLAWPWQGTYPKELHENTDFLGHRMADEFHCETLLRVRDEDSMWLWRQHFITLDKASYLVAEQTQ